MRNPTASLAIQIIVSQTLEADRRFVDVPWTKETVNRLHQLDKENSSHKTLNRTHALFIDYLPVKIKYYIGDAPDISNYATQNDVMIWTTTVYTGNTKLKTDSYVCQLRPEWYSSYVSQHNVKFDQVVPVKDFSCFINRMDTNRQSWFYLLIRRNLLTRGFVSFNMDTTRVDGFDSSVTSSEEVFEAQYSRHMTNFSVEHAVAKSIVPYKNFNEDAGLDHVIMQSRFNIILETYFSNNEEITFTEKTIRSLRLPRPWLLYAASHAVETLRSWGFDTLDDLVDHSRYDLLDDCIQRQSVVLDIAQELCNFDVEQHWERLQQAAIHNSNLLKQWSDDLPAVARNDTIKLLNKVYSLHGAK